MKNVLWLCGVFIYTSENNNDWAVKGIFSSEELAKEQCSTMFHFIGPLTLDEVLLEKIEYWEGAYYPLACNVSTDSTEKELINEDY